MITDPLRRVFYCLDDAERSICGRLAKVDGDMNMSEASLDDVLNGVEETTEEDITETEVTEDTTAEETGQEAEPDATAATEETTDEGAEQEWTYHAVKDERTKRQAAEDRAKELEKQLQQVSTKPTERPDLFENPEGFVESLTSEFEQTRANDRANMSEFYLRREKDDVDDKLALFEELSKDNPAYLSQVQQSISPWHEMYDIADKHLKMQELQNVDSYEAKVRAEIEAKVRAEYEGKAKQDAEKRESITPSLASKRSAGGLPDKTPGSESLEEILGR